MVYATIFQLVILFIPTNKTQIHCLLCILFSDFYEFGGSIPQVWFFIPGSKYD